MNHRPRPTLRQIFPMPQTLLVLAVGLLPFAIMAVVWAVHNLIY